MKVKNELSQFPATKNYVDFGLEQTELVNKRYKEWLSLQSFANDIFPSEFVSMKVTGHSDYMGIGEHGIHKPYEDRIGWDLRFATDIKSEPLSEALLYEAVYRQRFPNITTFNSKPSISAHLNYIEIGVDNNDRGWVKKGEFPENIYIEPDYDAIRKVKKSREEFDEKELKIPVQTNVRREALAGFNAAFYWQCFREMAVDCSDIVRNNIKNEVAKIAKVATFDWNLSQHFRSRNERVYEFFLNLLPDVRAEQNQQTALKQFYHPGALEAIVALELDHGFHHHHGKSDSIERPIFHAKGTPIKIIGVASDYDAIINFSLNLFNTNENKPLNNDSLKVLRKKYDVKIDKEGEFHFSLYLENANRIEEEIRNGSTDTEIHRKSRILVEDLRAVNQSLERWKKEISPAIIKHLEKIVIQEKKKHFSELEEEISN